MQHRFNVRNCATTYQIGDSVLLKQLTVNGLYHSLGLSSAYIGPYQVISKFFRVSYLIEYIDEDGYSTRTTAQINILNPFHRRCTAETFLMKEEDKVTL
ncbi:hypothetical protein AYI68_g5407 [Smittium mucronatum]|uniref:Uncharacterized protein n=1 Tax=Smittium mucronatum TaxID=133383 RepID=A0A1R0GUB8_9FUNG|nr:hypothetical protein AYI68_g5407 [Smittium mucronatum]